MILYVIKQLAGKLTHSDPMIVTKESSKDQIISTVMRFTKDGWPDKKHENSIVELFKKNKIY